MSPRRAPDEPVPVSLSDRVAEALVLIRPLIRQDGGDVDLVGVDADGTVRIRLLGACVGCPSSPSTIRHGIEASLRKRVPEVTRVVCV